MLSTHVDAGKSTQPVRQLGCSGAQGGTEGPAWPTAGQRSQTQYVGERRGGG